MKATSSWTFDLHLKWVTQPKIYNRNWHLHNDAPLESCNLWISTWTSSLSCSVRECFLYSSSKFDSILPYLTSCYVPQTRAQTAQILYHEREKASTPENSQRGVRNWLTSNWDLMAFQNWKWRNRSNSSISEFEQTSARKFAQTCWSRTQQFAEEFLPKWECSKWWKVQPENITKQKLCNRDIYDLPCP